MTVQKFLVAPQDIGLELDMEPWLLPDSAYVTLEDAYLFRKRGKRRRGNQFLARLVEESTVTYAAAVTGADSTFTNATDPLASQPITNVLVDTPAPGQTRLVFGTNHLINNQTFILNGIVGTVGTVLNNILLTATNITGTTVDVAVLSTGLAYTSGGTVYLPSIQPGSVIVTIGPDTFVDQGDGTLSGGTGGNTIDYLTGVFVVNFAPLGGGPFDVVVTFSFFPQRPAMGLLTWETLILGNHDTIGFDTVKANLFNVSNGTFQDISFYDHSLDPVNWTGTNTDFFQNLNYSNAFFATNNVAGFHGQQITLIQVDTPVVGQVTITFGANVMIAADTVFFFGITGTIASIINNLSFSVVSATATTIVISLAATGLAGAGGTAFVSQHTITGDGIRWYANDANVDGWLNFNPPLRPAVSGSPGAALKGGRILVAYRGRMLVLGTIEGDPTSNSNFNFFPNRARWSQLGTPFYTLPVPQNQTVDGLSWRDDIPGRGNFTDAPTNERIIGAEFIRDTLIVFFERSTWQLRYTGDRTAPFVWIRINIEFGSGSQFSVVPFDRGVLAVGNRGIITSDGNNVSRIDLIIPDTVYSFFSQQDGAARVYGIRDFVNELVYWTYVDKSENGLDNNQEAIFPNKLLVYNYREHSYGIFNDSYTCFGTFFNSQSLNWEDADIDWEDADFTWDDEVRQAPQIIAGTNTGYVMILNQQTVNDTQIQIIGITNATQAVVTTCGEHNLINDSFVKITLVNGMTQINNLNTQITVIDGTSFQCIDIDSTSFGAYTNDGQVTRINNFDIVTKRFNPFVDTGKSVLLKYIDFYTDFVDQGQVTVNIYVDENSDTPVNVPLPGQPQLWQEILPLDQKTTPGLDVGKVWNRFNCHTRGQFVQFEMTMSKAQMLDDAVNSQEFVWHAFILHLATSGRLIL